MEAEAAKKRTRWTWPLIIGIPLGGWLAVKIVAYLMVRLEDYFNFWLWDTWLGYLGLLCGLISAAAFNWPPLRSAIVGYAAGLAVLIMINVVVPTPPSCLQNSKGWDILRAYSISCPPAR